MAAELRGELTSERLIEVLRQLQAGNLYGTLVITEGLLEKCFFFARGGLRLVTSGRKPIPFADYLHALGYFDAEVARSLALAGKRNDEGLKSMIQAASGLSGEDYDKLDRELMVEEFLECLLWREAYFDFKAGDPDEDAYRAGLSARLLSLGVKVLVEDVIQKTIGIRELLRGVGDDSQLVFPTEAGVKFFRRGSRGPMESLLRLANKEEGISISELRSQLAGWSTLRIARSLVEAQGDGLVTLQRSTNTAEARLDKVREIEDGLEEAISPIMKRQALARAYEQNNDKVAAARHYKRSGLLLLRAKRDGDAASDLGHAVELDGEDFEAREGWIDALWASRQRDQARHETEAIARRYFDLGLVNRARKVLAQAVENLGNNDADLLVLLVRAYLKLGRSDKGLELGQVACAQLRAQGRIDEAIALADRFMDAGIDSSKVLAMSGEKNRQLLRQGLFLASAILFFLLLPASLLAQSKLHFAKRSEEIHEALGKLDLQGARQVLEELRREGLFGMSGLVAEFSSELSAQEETLEAINREFRDWVDPETNQIDFSRQTDLGLAEAAIANLALLTADKGPRFESTVAVLKARLERHKEEGEALRRAYKNAYSLGEHEKVYACVAVYLRHYRNVPDLHNSFNSIGIPIRIRTLPSGAKVQGFARQDFDSDGIAYAELSSRSIKITKPGYKTFEKVVDPREMPFDFPVIVLEEVEKKP
jgi:hypothetical protein